MKIVLFLIFVGLIVYFFDLPEELGKLWSFVLDLTKEEAGRRMIFVLGVFAAVPVILIYLVFHFHP